MPRHTSKDRIQFRVSADEMRTISTIQSAGQFPTTSSTVRFCISFTKTVLSIMPEAIGEAFIEAMEDRDSEL